MVQERNLDDWELDQLYRDEPLTKRDKWCLAIGIGFTALFWIGVIGFVIWII